MNSILRKLMTASRLQYFPVKVRAGIAQGAAWTLLPFSSYWRGDQEPEMHNCIKEIGIRSGSTCYDLGAHFGIYSVGLARMVGPTGQVVAFEPNPASFDRLERHRRMNRLDWLKTYRAAASDCCQQSKLLTYGSLNSTTTHLAYEGETISPESSPITINSVTLDSLVNSKDIRLPRFVKIDVEGHAHKAHAGAASVLKSSRPTLIVGMHSPQEVEGVLSILEPLDYRYSVIGNQPSDPNNLIGCDVLFHPR